jgi:hypothetical protein
MTVHGHENGGQLTAKYSLDSAQWWRHSDYEIRAGCIVPAPRARLIAYNPWTAYRATDGVNQAREPNDRLGRCAYTHLLDVARTLEAYVNRFCGEGQNVQLAEDEREAILGFTKQYGLLGVLHNDFLQIVDPGSGSEGRRAWIRQGGSWNVDPSNVLDANTDVGCVKSFGGNALTRASFADLRKKFYSAGMPAPMPNPKTPEFFAGYVEPVWEFAIHADWFKSAVESLIGFGDASDLNRYLSGISTRLRFRDGQLVEDPTYASLLTICADWFKRDHLAGFRLASCEACQQIFVSNYQRTRFCSQNCRWKNGKRRQRAQQKRSERGNSR